MNWRLVVVCAAMLAASVVCGLAAFGYARHQCDLAGGNSVGVYKGTVCVSDDGRVIEP